MTLEEVLAFVKQLPLIDQVRLIERIAPEVERGLVSSPPVSRQSLWGLCANLGTTPSTEDIRQARQEEWGSFPREDV
ncbi:MAG: hypothetical protein HC936_07620 [Leptolyngbyaceae cyanobacterium SU_3_3]|nr:hypothetical protein [Leptolyngbyaceae cyanobacterium SU_3_3]NJR53000.1 hypothetical protein [Leptolyngbyaceae cyanobacterium CSU_1_3]